jgi:hypothetical protein
MNSFTRARSIHCLLGLACFGLCTACADPLSAAFGENKADEPAELARVTQAQLETMVTALNAARVPLDWRSEYGETLLQHDDVVRLLESADRATHPSPNVVLPPTAEVLAEWERDAERAASQVNELRETELLEPLHETPDEQDEVDPWEALAAPCVDESATHTSVSSTYRPGSLGPRGAEVVYVASPRPFEPVVNYGAPTAQELRTINIHDLAMERLLRLLGGPADDPLVSQILYEHVMRCEAALDCAVEELDALDPVIVEELTRVFGVH